METIAVLTVILSCLIVLFIVQAVQYSLAMKNFLNQTEHAILNKKDYEKLKSELSGTHISLQNEFNELQAELLNKISELDKKDKNLQKIIQDNLEYDISVHAPKKSKAKSKAKKK